MAIAYDNASHSAFLNSTSNNLSHATSSSDRLLCVYIYSTIDNVTGATYNGTSCTFVNKLLMTGGAAGQYIHFYYLLNPTSGTNTVTVTSSSGLGGYISAVSYTGVKQSGQPDANNTNGSSSTTSLTTSVTTTADNCWLMGYAYMNGSMTAGTGTTFRGGSVAGTLETMDSNSATTPAGSDSLITNRGTASFAGHVIAAFSPSVSTTIKTYDGIVTANVKTVLNGTAIANRKTWNGIA